jgi:hypothetical protein
VTAVRHNAAVFVLGDLSHSAVRWVNARMSTQARRRVRLLDDWAQLSRKPASDLSLVSWLRFLQDPSEQADIRAARPWISRFLLFLGDSPTEAIPGALASLNVRRGERVHLAQLEPSERPASYILRLAEALGTSDSQESIVDAWWEGEEFVVLSPEFRRVRVPLGELPKLSKAPAEERRTFEIDKYGDFVYWPSRDLHMGWAEFLQAADPRAGLRAQQRSREFNKRYGRAIREFRKRNGLAQREIVGLSDRTVRRIEQGLTRATTSAIQKLADAHGLSPTEYMNELARLLPNSD